MEVGISAPGESPTGSGCQNLSVHRGWDVGCGAQSKSETGPGPCPGHTLLSPITSPGINLQRSDVRSVGTHWEQQVAPQVRGWRVACLARLPVPAALSLGLPFASLLLWLAHSALLIMFPTRNAAAQSRASATPGALGGQRGGWTPPGLSACPQRLPRHNLAFAPWPEPEAATAPGQQVHTGSGHFGWRQQGEGGPPTWSRS